MISDFTTSPFRKVVIRNPFVEDDEGFARLVRRCEDAGVTHLTFTEIPHSLWEIDDPWDPYLQWSVVHTSIFKLFPPPLLAEWVPGDYAKRARELVARKAEILQQSSIKGAIFLYDPMYWPETVFQAYPELRGPRVDAPAQSIHPRYAPCIDHPEVLAMYRTAFLQLYELSQGTLDLVVFRTNDSATGFCWTHLYSGLNGPESCKHISTQSRTKRFLTECKAGITAKGGQVDFYLGGGSIGFPDPMSFAASLTPEFGYYAHDRARQGGEGILSGFTTDFSLYPILHIPNTWEIMERLAMAKEKGWPEIILFTCPSLYGHDWQGDVEIVKMLQHFNQSPAVRLPEKIDLARKVASHLYGEENANDMVESWYAIHQAARSMNKNTIGMANLIFYGMMAQRWLTRPLVAYPELLTAEEERHYKIHLFQASPTHDQPDLLDQSDARQFDGVKHLDYFNKHFADVRAAYQNAQACIARVVERTGREHAELCKRLAALEVLQCVLQALGHWLNFQLQLEHVKNTIRQEQQGGCGVDSAGRIYSKVKMREEMFVLSRLVRSEIDNSLQLASLLEQNPHLVEMAQSEGGETQFLLGPELPQDLRRKADIMFKHVADIDFLTGFKPAFVSAEKGKHAAERVTAENIPQVVAPSKPAATRGFTLTEVLTVLGILTVLMAILIPSLIRMQIGAEDARCRAQLRQVAQAGVLYGADNNGLLPGYWWFRTSLRVNDSNARPMKGGMAEYLGLETYIAGPGMDTILTCPTAQRSWPSEDPAWTYNRTYAMNEWAQGYAQLEEDGLSRSKPNYFAEVEYPERMLFFMDAPNRSYIAGRSWFHSNTVNQKTRQLSDSDTYFHSKKVNISYVSGSVDSVTYEQMQENLADPIFWRGTTEW